jgi:TPP-dependent trihydroxycyclohexane-1,2-dione (THcHDO) dehydratase
LSIYDAQKGRFTHSVEGGDCTSSATMLLTMAGDADWDVGVTEVSSRESVQSARKQQEQIRAKQRIGV